MVCSYRAYSSDGMFLTPAAAYPPLVSMVLGALLQLGYATRSLTYPPLVLSWNVSPISSSSLNGVLL